MTAVLLSRRAQHLYMVVYLEHILLARGAGMGMSSPLQTLSEKTWGRNWFALVMLCLTYNRWSSGLQSTAHEIGGHPSPVSVGLSAESQFRRQLSRESPGDLLCTD